MVKIGYDLLGTIDFSVLVKQQVLIVVDSGCVDYLPIIMSRLQSIIAYRGIQIDHIIIPQGEHSKTWAMAERVLAFLLEKKHNRETVLIALGGGVVGDLTGFCASIYLRGVEYIQIPTTLLAQVDSSIGGKTAVNYHGAKNVIGSFYKARALICDINVLNTLPQREFISGLSEVLKYGLVLDPHFFDWVEKNGQAILDRDPHCLQKMISRCIALKQSIVAKDEKDKGDRIFLNFGHTLAHALESDSQFQLLHGEAVGLGLLAALALSEQYFTLDPHIAIRVKKLLIIFGLPIQISGKCHSANILELIAIDKKNKKWVLLTAIGHPQVVEIDDTVINLDSILQALGAVV